VNIVMVTQDTPFYLAENIDHLLGSLPAHSRVVACVLLPASPFGRRVTDIGKMWRTLWTFGPGFAFHYGFRFIAGRLMPARGVRSVLRRHGVPVLKSGRSINSRKSREAIAAYRPDLIVSLQANVIFKKLLLETPSIGCLNVHTALLPKYRGLMPTFWALKHNEAETGVSVFFMDEGIDSGPILVQKRLEIGDLSLDGLIRRTKRMGVDALLEAIDLVDRGDYQLIANDDCDMTYFSFPSRQDVREFLGRGKRFFR
jgi:methionyl-tRNA formyltransferase